MTDINKTGRFVFKMRGGIWTVFFIVVLFFAHPDAMRSIIGIPLLIAGQLIRLWASGCIERYRGEDLQAPKLTVWGPYAFVRNPLYVGNGLIGLGWSFLAGWNMILPFIVLFFIVYDYFIIPVEEKFLEAKFGDEYKNYKERTGRFFPKRIVAENIRGPFNSSILWKSESHSILMTVLGTLIILSRHWW